MHWFSVAEIFKQSFLIVLMYLMCFIFNSFLFKSYSFIHQQLHAVAFKDISYIRKFIVI